MKTNNWKLFLLISLFVLMIQAQNTLQACTNIIITKGASVDGSVMMVYTNDGEWLYKLDKTQAMDHKPGDSLEFTSGRNKTTGKIPQIPHTYAVLGFQMNEYQVAIGETTFTGREELWNKAGFLEYWHLMRLALERARTAREAIRIMTEIVEKYGYGSEGESFSIIDPDEAWILEMIGPGTCGKGAIWVAVKIPDGMISAHANLSRIGEFPLDDPENCLYSNNVITFAVEHGFYNPESGKPFRFNEAYNPPTPDRLKYCESRVWSIFRRSAPSLQISPEYHRGVKGAQRYPLWIKPDHQLSVQDIINLVRDHYEGTPYDMTKGITAGPFGSPNLCRPLFWDADSVRYSWERPISTMNTAFSFIAQAQRKLPDDVGGLIWFGVDDTYFSCYFPVFNSVTEIAKPFATGDIQKFSWESAWWVFNFVSNYANLRYSYMIRDIQAVQSRLETEFLSEQDSLVEHALKLEPAGRQKFLTNYSVQAGEKVQREWTALAENLLTRYNDGYIKDEKGAIRENGYPDEWKSLILENEPDKFRIPVWGEEKNIEDVPY